MRHSSPRPSRSAHRRQASPLPRSRGRRILQVLLIGAVALALVAGLDAVVASRLSGPATKTIDAAGLEQAAVARTASAVCTLTVPSGPLTAHGLMTPYLIKGTSQRTGSCSEADPGESAFVEAVIYDPATHGLSIYRPVVVNAGDQPATAPTPVALPDNAVVGIWISFNGRTLTVKGPGSGHCVDGVGGSTFGTFASCNAPTFFSAVTADHQVRIPAPGKGTDGLPCPTSRDFSVVDQDQSDDVATAYRIVNGQVAQDTTATHNGSLLTSGPDHRLLTERIDPALGCTPFLAPDLTDGGHPAPALALDELVAATHQSHAALVPANDPTVRVNNNVSVRKTNLFRAAVDQPPFPAGQSAGGYCDHLGSDAPQRLKKDAALFAAAPSPAQGAKNLLVYLQQRLQATAHELHCSRSTVSAVTPQGSGKPVAPGAPGAPGIGSTSGGATSGSGGSFIAPGADGIVWGSSVMAYPNETNQQALSRVETQLQPQVLREYNTGAPKWPSDGNSSLILSFKLPPADVVAGKDDALLQQFFAETPRPTYFTYWHEPEDDIEKGHFTAAQYRAAWAHITAIARASGKPLRATLILMGYTARPSSHRNWRDYYPGPDSVDVIAWDSYEWGPNDTPDMVFGGARAVAAEAGKPWAVAETGVSLVAVPDPAARNQRLTALSHYLATANPRPEFVSYFDSEPDSTWKWNVSRIPSAAAAWRAGQ